MWHYYNSTASRYTSLAPILVANGLVHPHAAICAIVVGPRQPVKQRTLQRNPKGVFIKRHRMQRFADSVVIRIHSKVAGSAD